MRQRAALLLQIPLRQYPRVCMKPLTGYFVGGTKSYPPFGTLCKSLTDGPSCLFNDAQTSLSANIVRISRKALCIDAVQWYVETAGLSVSNTMPCSVSYTKSVRKRPF